MSKRSEAIKQKLDSLALEGLEILQAEQYRRQKKAIDEIYGKNKEQMKRLDQLTKNFPLNSSYQKWYSVALPTVRVLGKDRLLEFESLYKIEKRKLIDVTTFGISDYLNGITTRELNPETLKYENYNYYSTFQNRFETQINIIQSLSRRIDDVLSDIEGALQAQLFDTELSSAEELVRANHLRAAGVLAGVTLEAHLGTVCRNRMIVVKRANLSLSDYNELLKAASIVDQASSRRIQHLAELRNLCAHKKDRDPTKDEVIDLISGVKTIVGTVS